MTVSRGVAQREMLIQRRQKIMGSRQGGAKVRLQRLQQVGPFRGIRDEGGDEAAEVGADGRGNVRPDAGWERRGQPEHVAPVFADVVVIDSFAVFASARQVQPTAPDMAARTIGACRIFASWKVCGIFNSAFRMARERRCGRRRAVRLQASSKLPPAPIGPAPRSSGTPHTRGRCALIMAQMVIQNSRRRLCTTSGLFAVGVDDGRSPIMEDNHHEKDG